MFSWAGLALWCLRQRTRLSGFALAALVSAAWASDAQSAPIIAQGQIAVTGFSGSYASPPPPNGDPSDYLTINTRGPSVRVVDLSGLGPQGQLSNVQKPFTGTADQVGQVFGVTLDSAVAPNIYVAATSAYGLSIFVPDPSSAIVKRVRVGTSGAEFVPGQFGPSGLAGGPQSIWRIDGTTGQASLFANVGAGSPEEPAGLGGLAFDPVSQQLFVADRTTGLIHRLGLDGTDRGTYDHGVQGLPDVGLAPVPPDPAVPIDITSPAFDTQNPSTWGFASPQRRVFAVAAHSSRLFYSVAQPQQVWSVGIAPDGSFFADTRLEVDVPPLQDGSEISSITFDARGLLYIAERGPTTGDYNLVDLATGGQSRVLRFHPKQPGDPAPGFWSVSPDQYAIGLPPQYNNANGGVALGYGYRADGQLDRGSCGTTVWSTGERLLDPGTPGEQPGSYPTVDGLQGNAATLIEPQNMPPVGSWFVDYYDQPSNPDNHGFMGADVVLPCQGGSSQLLPPLLPPPLLTCPPGTVFSDGQCLIPESCPPDTVFSDGLCIYPSCPPGYVTYNGQCVPPPQTCPPGTFFHRDRCEPIGCPPGLRELRQGYCTCPPGSIYFDGRCVPPNRCPPDMIATPGGICWCPQGDRYDRERRQCVPDNCPPGMLTLDNGRCGCPPNEHLNSDNRCVSSNCPPGMVPLPGGQCGCPPNEHLNSDNRCVSSNCPPGMVPLPGGQCGCPPNEHLNSDNRCVSSNCPPGMVPLPGGQCGCPPNEHLNSDNRCIANACPAGETGTPPNCAVIKLQVLTRCPSGQHLNSDKQCVLNTCPAGQTGTPPDCKAGTVEPLLRKVLTCEKGTHGTPPNCVADKCPAGTVGVPPSCKTPNLRIVSCPRNEIRDPKTGQCVLPRR